MNNKNVLKLYLNQLGFRQEDAAKIWGTSRITAWRKLTNPEKMTLKELVIIWENLPKQTMYEQYSLLIAAFDATLDSMIEKRMAMWLAESTTKDQ